MFSLFLHVFKTVVTCFYSNLRDVDFFVGINADPNIGFDLCNDSFCVGIFMSNNCYVCRKITFEMAVLSSLSPIRRANCVEEAKDSWLLYRPASSSHKFFSLHALGCMYSAIRRYNCSYGNEAKNRSTEQLDKRRCHLSDLYF